LGTVNEFIPERLNFAIGRLNLLPQESTGDYFMCGHIEIGANTVIQHGVSIYGPVKIGSNCLIKPNTVIGAKGFSFGFDSELTPHAIGHSGGVIIGDNVEIGSLCTVCQGTVKDTIIENYVKIDDHVHIAHNCIVKAKTIITAGVTFGGGAVVGECCWVGLNATVMNKVRLAAMTLVGAGANVIRDSEYGDVLAGNPARVLRKRE
jgi:UDP-3-O-[3-hydroxymyristoyl] glucosamine N-acyltransferase